MPQIACLPIGKPKTGPNRHGSALARHDIGTGLGATGCVILLRIENPRRVEGNVVVTYLDAFDPEPAELEELKARYRRGGLGDGAIKKRLEEILQALIAPIRERRAMLSKDQDYLLSVIRQGTERAREQTEATRREVIEALGLFRL